MVHKIHITKRGRTHGPYYYETYREDGKVKKRYLGTEPPRGKKRVILPWLIVLSVTFLILFFTFNPSGNVTLDIDESYSLNEKLSGSFSVVIDQGDRIHKNTEIEVALEKDGSVVSQKEMTFEEFVAGQIDYVEVSSIEQVCTTQTVENCEDETRVIESCVRQTGGDVPLVCTNETVIENVCREEEVDVCVNETTSDFYYEDAGTYSRDIEEFIDYTITEAGGYRVVFSVSDLGLSDEQSFVIDEPVAQEEIVEEEGAEEESVGGPVSETNQTVPEPPQQPRFTIQSTPGEIDVCQTLDMAGVYTLNQSINSSGTCFIINVNNVELDCQGFNVTYGDTGTGIGVDVGPQTNITIRNCEIGKGAATLTQDNIGIRLSSTSLSLVENNIISTNGGSGPPPSGNFGISLTSSSNNKIISNNISTLGAGGDAAIRLISSHFNTISNSTVSSSSFNNLASQFCG